MPKLSSTFELNDKYSKAIDRILGKTAQVDKAIGNASKSTDQFNSTLSNIDKHTGGLDNVLGKFLKIGTAAAGLKKTIDGMFTGVALNAQQTAQLNALQAQYGDKGGQGVYDWVADYASKSVLGREDLMQSVSMSAPFIKSQAQLEKYVSFMDRLYAKDPTQGAQGASFAMKELMSGDVMSIRSRYGITGFSGDTIRKMFQAGDYDGLFDYMDDVFNQFGATQELVDRNFSNITSKWNVFTSNFKTKFAEASESVVSKLSPIVDKLNEMLDTGKLDIFINAFILIGETISTVMGWAVDGIYWFTTAMQDNWNIVFPILLSLGTVLTALFVMMLTNFARVAIGWIMAFWPVMLVIGLISLLIYFIVEMGDTFASVCGFVAGSFEVLFAVIDNFLIFIANTAITVCKTIDTVITSFVNLAISGINSIIGALNMIPGVNLDTFNSFDGMLSGVQTLEYKSIGDAWERGNAIGGTYAQNTTSGFTGLKDSFSGALKMFEQPSPGFESMNLDKFMGGGEGGGVPITNGKGGKPLKTKMDKDDIKYIKDLAEKDYIAKFSSSTLAPSIQVTFGDVKETADINQIEKALERIITEQISIVTEG